MELLTDVAFLSRLQFTLTVAFHFVFVPISIGIGLVNAIAQTRCYRNRTEENQKAAWFWTKVFTATFVVGVATGITMEFSFGTNWADYSRFVGDIFGAPLAAEALFAFFLESVFLGVLLFGRDKVSPRFYTVSAWLVWGGSCLSALWILIANSWMQTPAGAELAADGSKAVLTDFFAAAFNPSTGNRFFHTLTAALVMGGLCAVAVAAYYFMKGRSLDFARKTMKTGLVLTLVATVALFASAHSTAVGVWNEQPTKLAAMEGQYESEVPPLYLFGWVDEGNQTVYGPSLPGMTSMLATGTLDTEYPGLNDLAQTEQYGELDPATMPVNGIFQTYHLMVAISGVLVLLIILAFIGMRKGKLGSWKWLQWVLFVSPLFPIVAIEAGWFTAELGRQPWVVYPSANAPDGVSLLTDAAYSHSVSAFEMWVTIALFVLIYLVIFIAWIRIVAKFVKEGPEVQPRAIEDRLADEFPLPKAAPEVAFVGAAEAAASSLDVPASAGAVKVEATEEVVVAPDAAAQKGGE